MYSNIYMAFYLYWHVIVITLLNSIFTLHAFFAGRIWNNYLTLITVYVVPIITLHLCYNWINFNHVACFHLLPCFSERPWVQSFLAFDVSNLFFKFQVVAQLEKDVKTELVDCVRSKRLILTLKTMKMLLKHLGTWLST